MIATHVSRPIRSARASGPIGWLKPSFAIVSIASASATRSWSAQAASLMNGIRIRFETKPGKSLASAGIFPSSRASSTIAAAVSSEVDGSLLGRPAEVLPHRFEPASDRPRSRVVERDAAAGSRDRLGDPAAHLARADDEDVLEVHPPGG